MINTLTTRLNGLLAGLGATLILVTGVLLATSSGGDAAAKPAVAAVAADRVEITDFEFAAEAITVAAGTTIRWTNADAAPHTATSGASPVPDGLFDTDIIKQGQTRSVKVSKPGTYEYYCALHPFMHGTVIVT